MSRILGRADLFQAEALEHFRFHLGLDRLVGEQRIGIVLAERHQVVIGLAVVDLAAGQRDDERQTLRVGADVDLGREAATRPTEGLFRSPPFAPAAC